MNARATLRTLLYTLFRRQKLILRLSAGMLGTILLVSLLRQPQYQASCSILIQERAYRQLLSPESKRNESWVGSLNLQETINSEIEIARSRPVLERAVTSLKLDAPREVPDRGFWGAVRQTLRAGPQLFGKWLTQMGLLQELSPQEAFEAAVIQLEKRLWIGPVNSSQIVKIAYRDPDPVMASQVVNNVAEEYRRQRLAFDLNQAERSFYAEQISQVEGELKALQDQLANLRSQQETTSFSAQRTALLNKVQSFDAARTAIQKEIFSRRSKVESIQEARQLHPNLLIPLPEMAQDKQLQDLENKLVNLRYQLSAMQQHYTPESRQVVTARKQEEATVGQIRQQVDQLLEREAVQLRALAAEEHALTQTIQTLEAELKGLPAKEEASHNLEEQVKHLQDLLTVLRKQYQEILVAQAADSWRENTRLVSPAAVPLRPVTPNWPLSVALGLILSLVVSLSAAFLVEYWDDSLKEPEDFEQRLGRSVLASIPEL